MGKCTVIHVMNFPLKLAVDKLLHVYCYSWDPQDFLSSSNNEFCYFVILCVYLNLLPFSEKNRGK